MRAAEAGEGSSLRAANQQPIENVQEIVVPLGVKVREGQRRVCVAVAGDDPRAKFFMRVCEI
jgi:hypothetical protein